MKKTLRCMVMTLLLVLVSVSAYGSEDTDDGKYDFLEDMTVKELKELRSEINKLLGDGGESADSDDNSVEKPKKDTDQNGFKLDINEEHYKLAIKAARDLQSNVKSRTSLQVSLIGYSYKEKNSDGVPEHDIYISYSAANAFGAMLDDVYQCEFDKNGNMGTTFSWLQNFSSSLVSSLWGSGEYMLDVDFIMSNL